MECYLAHFPAISDSPQFITGEASPLYFYDAQARERIKQLHFPIKLIIMLRNPVERTISEYYHALNHGIEHRSLTEVIELEAELIAQFKTEAIHQFGYLFNSIYLAKIAQWTTNFPPENILVIESESFFQQTNAIMTEIWNFLGVTPIQEEMHIAYNVGSYSPVASEVRQKLHKFFAPYNQELEAYLGRKFNWS